VKKTHIKLIIALAIFLIIIGLATWNPLQVVQWKVTDLFFRGKPPSDLITIIAIDDKSLSPEAGLGRFKDWPRSYYAQLLRAFAKNNPKVAAFDLDFRQKSRGMSELRLIQLLRDYERFVATAGGAQYGWHTLLKRFEPQADSAELTHPDDVDFQKAIDESNFPVALSSELILSEEPSGDQFPANRGAIEPIFKGANAEVGFRNVLRDRDGVLRRFQPWVEKMPFFPLAISNAYALGKEQIAPDAYIAGAASSTGTSESQEPIRYTAKPFSYRTISFYDALRGNYEPEAIAGKIVLVGATARVLQDFHLTPTSRDAMPGVEINANIVQQILDAKFSREQGSISLFILLAVFTLGGSFIFFKLTLRASVLIFAAILIGYPAAAFALYQTGTVLNVIYPEIAWLFTALGTLWYRNQTEFREKRALKKAFAHYVSPVVVNEIAKNPAALKLGGNRKPVSVMFSDIVGFTTLAEKLSPEDTVALLNDYLTAMTEVVFEYHGTLDKYQGDAIMALFGAPLDDHHHAMNACHTALAMRKALVTLHEKWNSVPQLPFKDELIKLDFRVGIATGPAVIGNVGSEKRFDYTAIGDIVNLGSRLESVNKKYGTHIIVDKNTFMAVTENRNPFVFRKLDTVRVKGKAQETEIFEVAALAENATSDMKSMLDDFENGRMLYTQRNFGEAKQYFEAALAKFPNDSPSQIYRNRCAFYLRKPPGREWEAVVGLEEK